MSHSKFIETICFENDKFKHLEIHQRRVNQTFAAYFQEMPPLSLPMVLNNLSLPSTKTKVRIEYDGTMHSVSIEDYKLKPINELQLVPALIDYDFKYADRSQLQVLYGKRGKSDDIIILKNFLITDSYYANIAFLKRGIWYTPSSYLLNGVKRQVMLAKGQLQEKIISLDHLDEYECVSLINAMIDLGEVIIPIENIKY